MIETLSLSDQQDLSLPQTTEVITPMGQDDIINLRFSQIGANWSSCENSSALQVILKNAFLTYGLPKLFYCDNGSVFSSQYLQLICARIGVALVHSKPYDSPSRGKIERFFRNCSISRFMPHSPRSMSLISTNS